MPTRGGSSSSKRGIHSHTYRDETDDYLERTLGVSSASENVNTRGSGAKDRQQEPLLPAAGPRRIKETPKSKAARLVLGALGIVFAAAGVAGLINAVGSYQFFQYLIPIAFWPVIASSVASFVLGFAAVGTAWRKFVSLGLLSGILTLSIAAFGIGGAVVTMQLKEGKLDHVSAAKWNETATKHHGSVCDFEEYFSCRGWLTHCNSTAAPSHHNHTTSQPTSSPSPDHTTPAPTAHSDTPAPWTPPAPPPPPPTPAPGWAPSPAPSTAPTTPPGTPDHGTTPAPFTWAAEEAASSLGTGGDTTVGREDMTGAESAGSHWTLPTPKPAAPSTTTHHETSEAPRTTKPDRHETTDPKHHETTTTAHHHRDHTSTATTTTPGPTTTHTPAPPTLPPVYACITCSGGSVPAGDAPMCHDAFEKYLDDNKAAIVGGLIGIAIVGFAGFAAVVVSFCAVKDIRPPSSF